MERNHHDGISGIGFMVNDRPVAVYGRNVRQHTRQFVESFDVSFWIHQLKLASSIPAEEATHDHLGFLRLILSQAEEHLFALIFALLQAPHCPDLWLYRYSPSDLPKMVERVRRQEHVLNRFRLTEISWKALSKVFWGDLSEQRHELTAMALERLAEHFVSDYSRDEYNGIKHGLRLSFGGNSLSFAPGGSPDKLPDPDSYISLGDSKFGSRFYSFKPLSGSKNQFRVTRRSSNWHLEVIASHLRHTVMLIENMGIPMRMYSDVEGEKTFRFFRDNDEYELDPSNDGKYLAMEEIADFDIPKSKRIDLDAVKNSYT